MRQKNWHGIWNPSGTRNWEGRFKPERKGGQITRMWKAVQLNMVSWPSLATQVGDPSTFLREASEPTGQRQVYFPLGPFTHVPTLQGLEVKKLQGLPGEGINGGGVSGGIKGEEFKEIIWRSHPQHKFGIHPFGLPPRKGLYRYICWYFQREYRFHFHRGLLFQEIQVEA